MTDAHCHVSCGDPSVREFLIGRDFFGVHPWDADELGGEDLRRKTEDVVSRLSSSVSGPFPLALPGIGEIGLDRLKTRDVSPRMREVFRAQLKLAFELGRPVVLHGAKCWGQVVGEIKNLESRIKNSKQRIANSEQKIVNSELVIENCGSSFLFHGFSRSDGLIPDIVKLNGYISVGPAVLNDHAVNYRELVKKIPPDRLLVETDRTPENAATCPSVAEVLAKTAELRGLSAEELERLVDANATAFAGGAPVI